MSDNDKKINRCLIFDDFSFKELQEIVIKNWPYRKRNNILDYQDLLILKPKKKLKPIVSPRSDMPLKG